MPSVCPEPVRLGPPPSCRCPTRPRPPRLGPRTAPSGGRLLRVLWSHDPRPRPCARLGGQRPLGIVSVVGLIVPRCLLLRALLEPKALQRGASCATDIPKGVCHLSILWSSRWAVSVGVLVVRPHPLAPIPQAAPPLPGRPLPLLFGPRARAHAPSSPSRPPHLRRGGTNNRRLQPSPTTHGIPSAPPLRGGVGSGSRQEAGGIAACPEGGEGGEERDNIYAMPAPAPTPHLLPSLLPLLPPNLP